MAGIARLDSDPVGALRRLMLFDAPLNPTFDRLTQLAAQLLEAPIALLTLVDADRRDRSETTWAADSKFTRCEKAVGPLAVQVVSVRSRQFLVSAFGLPEPLNSVRDASLEYSICQQAAASGLPVIIEDTRCEPLLRDNPAVADLGVIAYAGIPLIGRTARAMGTLCVIDIKPRDWPGDGLASLAHLADITMDEIRLHLHERLAAHRRECHTPLLRPND